MPKRLAESRVSVQIAESENGPALVTVPAQAIPRVTGQRSFVASLKLGVLPPGEYVARAVVSVPGSCRRARHSVVQAGAGRQPRPTPHRSRCAWRATRRRRHCQSRGSSRR